MELIAILVGGLLGWKHGTFGRRELQVMAVVIVGWTAATLARIVPQLALTVEGLAWTIGYGVLLVTVPYGLGVLAHRLARRRG